ncbi:MAG: ribonuclease P protein component [Candidatus Peregrinibacteria bacterium]|nr:ribonuclease P protein component [Candidatus Peregrinibacteria bacterium]
MIAKKFKIPKKHIALILQKGESFDSKLFVIRFWENKIGFPRFRIIVSTKFAKKAVDRNKTRRRIYEALRLIVKENSTLRPLDIILIPKKQILTKEFKEISQIAEETITKL